ncbi:MAG: hypothetical protein PUB96_06750 [Helicobacteraceae bacterium]|nr:hypothetical protein [Helicobacteraceae bacterium]
MKIVSFTPIKLNNQRTPGKNIKPFYDGTPLIHFILKTLLKVSRINERFVFCSDEAIKPYLLPGIKFLERPKELDLDSALRSDLIREFIKRVDADVYIMSHATSPFVSVETYDKCLDAILLDNYDSAFSAKKHLNFFWQNGTPLNFSLNNTPRTQDLVPIFAEATSPYAFKKEVFEKFGGAISDKPYICEVGDLEATDIDYPQDFVMADFLYKYFIKKDY